METKPRLKVGDVVFKLRHLTAQERLIIDRVSEQSAFSGEYQFVRANLESITRVTDHGGYRKEFGESFVMETTENKENHIRDIRLRFIRNFDFHLLPERDLILVQNHLL
jgi:hypothetical protein